VAKRVAFLRSFTLEPAIPLLRAEAYANGIDLDVRIGDFNAYSQEILDKESTLYTFSPDIAFLAVQTCDVAPDLWQQYGDLSSDAAGSGIRRVIESFQQWVRAFRENNQASLIVHTLELPGFPSLGVLDAQSGAGQSAAIEAINRELHRLPEQYPGVYVLDYDALVARYGRLHWRDERKWLTARMPIAADKLIHLAHEWLRFVVPLSGKTGKALVVDLDNTLWGGVVGEDGVTGIQLGPEYPGAAYQAVQRAMLDLYSRGILLAICSKNNLEDAEQVLRHHPGMLLKPEHFAAMRINWNDKAQNLCEIASELNIGRDALVFMDDNPAEREQVRRALPEVRILELPDNPLNYPPAVRDCLAFERVTRSSEDARRTTFYVVERERSKAEQNFKSKEDFYRFLGQSATISPVQPSTLARVAQLTQKTNQFNLTSRRYGEQEIAALAARPNWQVVSLHVRDRFGDHGLVGVAITHDENEVCEIDTFLLSCRVIGRTIESGMLSYLARKARAGGRKFLTGWYFPTAKNSPAQDFYARHRFNLKAQNGEGSLWAFDLTKDEIELPQWIELSVTNGG
jgi:FkbH-like protein